MKQRWNRPKFWFGMGISLLCLGWIFFFIDERRVWQDVQSADYRFLLLALVFMVIYMLLRALRWRYMLGNRITTLRIFHLQNIGYMLTQLLPLRLGDPVRAILVGREPQLNVGEGMATMMVERILDLLAIITLLPFTLLSVKTLPDWLEGGAKIASLLAIVALLAILFAANLRAQIGRLLDTLLPNTTPKRAFLLSTVDQLLGGLHTFTHWRSGLTLFLLSILPWLPIIAAYQCTMYAVGLTPTYTMAAFVTCCAALSIAAPSSPGQVGVFHGAAIAALTFLGFSAEPAASFAFVYHALNFFFLVILGLIGLRRGNISWRSLRSEIEL